MAMARASSGLAYPQRFFAAASYAGFDGSPHSSTKDIEAKFKPDVALILYALYKQAIVGPCNAPKPSSWSRVEQSKWQSWKELANMASTEAMRLFVKLLEILDLKGWTWSKVDVKAEPVSSESSESSSPVAVAPCAGHSLIPWENKLLSVAGHTKVASETIRVKAFDLQTGTWSNFKTYGQSPVSRGGQSVTLVGTSLVIFGGQDAKRTLLSDLHILDLETMTWDEVDAVGVPPSARSDHAAAVHVDRYLVIFGGGSHATCFNDLHVLDLQAMEWSRPTQQGEIPTPRAGHASVTIGENWFIVGGGDNKSGASETVVLNMSTLTWSVVTSVQGRVPLASEVLYRDAC
ncbi:hypothetical protein SLEP1_g28913 [Rubroshorea leprosula]|uniref:ACB domain-containing protein n=1 Tax=Rubroshorea leprosula TaxID=152421 RepID=A0AAV5JV67_9ROSI|nr:hypothetical protein SLEP1_g28913 [Rubroshorea leprosula]